MGFPNKQAKREYDYKYYQDHLELRRQQSREYGHSFRGKAHYLIRVARRRARKFNLEFTLNPIWAEQKLRLHCELTGVPFGMENEKIRWDSPTIDRINNSKGYTLVNCRLILFSLNAFKGHMTDTQMFKIAQVLIQKYPGLKGRC